MAKMPKIGATGKGMVTKTTQPPDRAAKMPMNNMGGTVTSAGKKAKAGKRDKC